MSGNPLWDVIKSSPPVLEFAREIGVSRLIAQLLVNRGIRDKISAGYFLKPRLAQLPDPMLFKGMARALETILRAIDLNEKITIYGDYDADGITATALLWDFFIRIGGNAACYIPNRLTEGYGLNKKAVKEIHSAGTGLIITVDCGISNSEEIALAKELGMEVIVTDHHLVPPNFHSDYPVVNPHQQGCRFPFKFLAGVGVAFFLVIAVRRALRERGMFKDISEPDLREYLDIAALGTVADRVPLVGLNRILVKNGLDIINGTRWPGLRALIDSSGLDGSPITGDDLAFRLAPRLNAPGRIDDPGISIEILKTENPNKAEELANRINNINSRRQSLEQNIIDEIENMISSDKDLAGRRTFLLASERWHPGVLGIVASKLVERYYRPVLLFSLQDGLAVGSGRSIEGFDLYGALCRFEHLYERFGGHSRAAGLALKHFNLDKLDAGFEEYATGVLGHDTLVPSVCVDAEISFADITFDLVNDINMLSPFGEGNPQPVFLSRSLEVISARVVGEHHMRLKVLQEDRELDAIGFGMADRYPLEERKLDMLFTPELNRWQGYDSIQLRIIDFSFN